MAKQSKIGVCENCGDKGALTGSFGRQVCSTCLKIRSNVNSHLPKIANAARSLHKADDLVGLLVGPEATHQLTSEAEAGALRTIAGIVGYDGTSGDELVVAVRKRVHTCASCDTEGVLHEIREIVGYTPDMGESGLAGAVRGLVAAGGKDCTNDEILLRDDLARACDMDQDYSYSWSTVVQNAIHELARLQDRRDYWCEVATDERTERAKLDAKLQDALGKLAVANGLIGEWSAKCDRLEAEAVANKAENARQREQQPESIWLLDVALAVIREEPVPAGKIASLIDAARRAA